MLEFLNTQNIPYRLEGKIVVDENLEKIDSLYERSKSLEMAGVEILKNSALTDKEPNSKILQGLFVPQAGVVDYKAVTEKMAAVFKENNGEIDYFQEIVDIADGQDSKLVSSKKRNF